MQRGVPLARPLPPCPEETEIPHVPVQKWWGKSGEDPSLFLGGGAFSYLRGVKYNMALGDAGISVSSGFTVQERVLLV